MKKYIAGTVLLAVSVTGIAHDERNVYFSILGGVQDFHSNGKENTSIMSNSLDESDAIAAELGFMVTDHAAFQLSYTKLNPNDAIGFGDEDMIMQSLDYMYYFKPEGSQGGPFLRFGVGKYEFDSEVAGGGWKESDIARAGLGFEQHLTDTFSWRGEFGVVRDTTTNRYDTQMLFGFSVNFGGGSRKTEDLEVVKPVVAPVVTSNTRKDADNDRVFDDVDQCPNTKPGVAVDQNGCELDSDGDGVVNSADACPDTPAGARVGKTGCRLMLEETVRMTLDVKFKNNSSQLENDFKSDIQRLAKFMTEYPDTNVVVEGHSDSVGKAEYNQWLSEQRAKTVMNELISVYGISASRVSAKGFGEAKPIADNNTATGRAKNRRVEAVIEATVVKPQ